jgi:hypothetical protein
MGRSVVAWQSGKFRFEALETEAEVQGIRVLEEQLPNCADLLGGLGLLQVKVYLCWGIGFAGVSHEIQKLEVSHSP